MTVNGEVEFALTVTNHGNLVGPARALAGTRGDPASTVVVTTTLLAGLTFVSSSSGCSASSGVVTCNVGNLADGASATVRITARAPVAPASGWQSANLSVRIPEPPAREETAAGFAGDYRFARVGWKSG